MLRSRVVADLQAAPPQRPITNNCLLVPFLYMHKNLLPNPDVVAESLRLESRMLTIPWKSGIITLQLDQQNHQGRKKSGGTAQTNFPATWTHRLTLPGADRAISHLLLPADLGGGQPGGWGTGSTDVFTGNYRSPREPRPITQVMHCGTILTLSINSTSSAVLPSSQSNIYKAFRRCEINPILFVHRQGPRFHTPFLHTQKLHFWSFESRNTKLLERKIQTGKLRRTQCIL